MMPDRQAETPKWSKDTLSKAYNIVWLRTIPLKACLMTGVPSSTSISCSISFQMGWQALYASAFSYSNTHPTIALPSRFQIFVDVIFLRPAAFSRDWKTSKRLSVCARCYSMSRSLGKVSTVKLTNADFVSVMKWAALSSQRPQLV